MTNFVIIPPPPFRSFAYWLELYTAFVLQVECGYQDGLDDYIDDLACRSELQRILDAGAPDVAPSDIEKLSIFDDRLRALLVPAGKSIHSSYPERYFWFYHAPHNAPEVIRDIHVSHLPSATE